MGLYHKLLTRNKARLNKDDMYNMVKYRWLCGRYNHLSRSYIRCILVLQEMIEIEPFGADPSEMEININSHR